jgi:hypothetical protein
MQTFSIDKYIAKSPLIVSFDMMIQLIVLIGKLK